MRKITFKAKNLKDKLIKKIKRAKEEHLIKEYFKNNILFGLRIVHYFD